MYRCNSIDPDFSSLEAVGGGGVQQHFRSAVIRTDWKSILTWVIIDQI